MKRKFMALLLAVACLMTMAMGTVSAAPAEAFEYTLTVDEQGNIIEPKASISLTCGLNKVSGSTYYAWARASGDNTLLSVTVFLYRAIPSSPMPEAMQAIRLRRKQETLPSLPENIRCAAMWRIMGPRMA